MSSENFLLLLRLGFSLSLVFGLMWVAARVLKGRAGVLQRARLDHLEILERKPLGKGSSIAIVRVGDDTLTVGITDNTITLLGHAEIELDVVEPSSADVISIVPASTPTDATVVATPAGGKRNLLDALRDKTVRHVAG